MLFREPKTKPKRYTFAGKTTAGYNKYLLIINNLFIRFNIFDLKYIYPIVLNGSKILNLKSF